MATITLSSFTKTISPFPFSKISWRGWGSALIFILSYSFLAYKLITFNRYSELSDELNQIPFSKFSWLAGVFILLPLNWLLESLKWRMLVAKVQNVSLINSLQAVLAGIFTGFFTPNRVGELVGRVGFLEKENQKAGVTLSVVNSLTQNLIMALCGIPACILFYLYKGEILKLNIAGYLSVVSLCLLSFGILYFILPYLSRQLKFKKVAAKLSPFTVCLSDYSKMDLLKVMLVTLIRYSVFCTQFYFILRFFGVSLEVWQALIAIPTSYLFVSFTPSIAFSEAAVRSSYAVLFIGAFSSQEIPIILAGVSIWFVNFVVPMLVGSVVMIKSTNLIKT